MRILSKYDSVNNFVNSIKGEFESSWTGYDGEYFKDGKFYVDNTCLCRVRGDVMYLSQNSMTPKCSLYLRELTVRSNELNVKVLYVPQWYGCDKRSHEFSNSDIIMAFRIVIFNLKDKRDVYSKTHMEEIYSTLSKLSFTPHKLLTDVEEILKKMNDAVKVEDKQVKKFIAKNNYYDIVQAAYFNAGDYDVKFRTALKRYLNPSGEYAFLKYNAEDDWVYSSECMCGMPKKVMTWEQAFNLSKAFYEGTARHGQKYGNYTVMRVMDNYIQVSCNKYCKDMFHAIYFELMKYSHVAEMK